MTLHFRRFAALSFTPAPAGGPLRRPPSAFTSRTCSRTFPSRPECGTPPSSFCPLRRTSSTTSPADTTTWAVTGSANVAYLKPGEEGATTNIVLVCESGNIYSFKVTEDENAEPDLVVYIDYAAAMIDEEAPGSVKPVLHEPKYVSRMDVAVYQEARPARRRECPFGLATSRAAHAGRHRSVPLDLPHPDPLRVPPRQEGPAIAVPDRRHVA